jgi:hypothetical protein
MMKLTLAFLLSMFSLQTATAQQVPIPVNPRNESFRGKQDMFLGVSTSGFCGEPKSLEKQGFYNRRPQCITFRGWVQSIFDE